MKAEAITQVMCHSSNNDFWLRILAPDASHESGALRIDGFSGEKLVGAGGRLCSTLAHVLHPYLTL
jgi:hypothetical protein